VLSGPDESGELLKFVPGETNGGLLIIQAIADARKVPQHLKGADDV